MKRMHRSLVVGLGLFLLGLPLTGSIFGGTKAPDARALSDFPMFGGSPGRNMANTVDKNIPIEWNVEEGKHKNIKWVAPLGSLAYGGPVIADGKVYIGTN